MTIKNLSRTEKTETAINVPLKESQINTLIADTASHTNNLDVIDQLELWGLEIVRRLDPKKRSTLGQFLTPAKVARVMVSMLDLSNHTEISLLDPGAGIGGLFAAVVEACCMQTSRPKLIMVTAYEIEPLFLSYLQETIKLCESVCQKHCIEFRAEIRNEDFITSAVSMLRPSLFGNCSTSFSHAILNPPYHKIDSKTNIRTILNSVCVETGNLYTAFLALTSMLLMDGGHLVSITPRSFCNGPYFQRFRKSFLKTMEIEKLHLFQSREEAFQEDDVLQENLIMAAKKGNPVAQKITISSSFGAEDDSTSVREVDRAEVISPEDKDAFIHILTDGIESQVAKLGAEFKFNLHSLGLQVSTGRVVDFRAKDFITKEHGTGCVPLIYPSHLDKGQVHWPKEGFKKPDAIIDNSRSHSVTVPSGNYVLVKRFSSKEEPKRIVAAVYDSSKIDASKVGFENHLNYFHIGNSGMDLPLAKGLAGYLNSTFIDTLFRNFSGHTQVNASDLRKLKYPSLQELEMLGKSLESKINTQEELDKIFEKELLNMAGEDFSANPIPAKKKIQEALQVLKNLCLPREQQNERSALTLLALLDLKPASNWREASNPLCGITPMMEFFSRYYGKTYKPNTRETVRRQTVHQFLAAGIITENPDDPKRPINSPKAVYQMEPSALNLLKSLGNSDWEANLRTYLASIQTLKERYALERKMKRIPVEIGQGRELQLSPGGQNILIKQVIEEFASRFTPGGQLVYVGDTDEKFAFFDETLLDRLGVNLETHGKMPDVIIYYSEKNWLVLIEAVTSHGPMNPKRREELRKLFGDSSAGLVFVTAFLARKAMVGYLSDISWETEVWVAEAPSHLIHFNGERFLGPYEI